jgi:hypothetical protein
VRLERDTTLYASPSRRLARGEVDDRSVFLGSQMWMPVLDSDPDGFQRVPVPWVKGSHSVWIRSAGLEHRSNRYVVVVSTTQRQLWVLERGEVAFRSAVTVGDASSPTPHGTFFVTDRVPVPPDQEDTFGEHAIGLSVLQQQLPAGWTGGNQVAIHGGPDSEEPRTAQTAGCVVVSNRVLDWLWPRLEAGTLVVLQD